MMAPFKHPTDHRCVGFLQVSKIPVLKISSRESRRRACEAVKTSNETTEGSQAVHDEHCPCIST
jgi:hypothetical protein